MLRAVIFGALVFFTQFAQASIVTITFDSNETDYWLNSVESNGFTFTDDDVWWFGAATFGTDDNLDGSSVDNGTIHLMDWVNETSSDATTTLVMTADDGGLFDLISLDFTSGYLDGTSIADYFTVLGYDSDDSLVAEQVFSYADLDYTYDDFTTLYFDDLFTDLAYIELVSVGSYTRVGYDNIVVDVPEPVSLAMFATGLLALAARRRQLK